MLTSCSFSTYAWVRLVAIWNGLGPESRKPIGALTFCRAFTNSMVSFFSPRKESKVH